MSHTKTKTESAPKGQRAQDDLEWISEAGRKLARTWPPLTPERAATLADMLRPY